MPKKQKGKKSPKLPDFKCVCNWDQCMEVSKKIYENAPNNHPWKGGSIAWRRTKKEDDSQLLKNELCRIAIKRTLEVESKDKTIMKLARHHYPVHIWEAIMDTSGKPGRPTDTLFSMEQAKDIDLLSTSNRLAERVNSVSYLTRVFIEKKPKEDYFKGHYVCVPIQPKNDTIQYVEKIVREGQSTSSYVTPNKKPHESLLLVDDNASSSTTAIVTDPNTAKMKLRKRLGTPFVPDPYPTFEQQQEYISFLYEQHYAQSNPEVFKLAAFRTLKDVATMYHQIGCNQNTIFKLPDDKYLHVCVACSGDFDVHCKMFIILERSISDRKCCDYCTNKKQRSQRQQQFQQNLGEDGSLANSRVNNKHLSETFKHKKLQDMAKLVNSVQRSKKRYKLILKEARESQTVTLDREHIPGILRQAFELLTTKGATRNLQQQIVQVLLDSQLKSKDTKSLQEDELVHYASRICTMMDNQCKKLTGNDRQVRFDARMMRIALAVFLEDGRSGLEKFRQRSIEIVPSLSSVQREYSHFRVKEDYHCPSLCAMFHDTLQSIGHNDGRKTTVQVMFDEIKLKCGIWFNCTTDEVYGFTASKNSTSLGFAEEIMHMAELDYDSEDDYNVNDDLVVDDGDDPEYNAVATYANVFRLRTATNQTYTVAYFLNSGSLDGDALLKQILYVITCCEMANLHVTCLLSDAGGNNVRSYSLLTKKKCLVYTRGLLSKTSVSFANPIYPSNLVFIMLCVVHGLKNMRNQFYSSRPLQNQPTRFLVNNGQKIQWSCIIRLYDHIESKKSSSRNVRQLPNLKQEAVTLDNWSKMNVHYAKVVFEEQTLNYQLNLLRERCLLDPSFFDKVIKSYHKRIGYEAELLLEKIKLLKQTIFSGAFAVPTTSDYNTAMLKDNMMQIEFSGYVHYIFIARFLNRNANLTREKGSRTRKTDGSVSLSLNISAERLQMKKCIEYFDDWRNWVQNQEANAWQVDKLQRLFIANDTFRNLKISVSSFFEYADEVLSQHNTKLIFVPFLHANQSSIEAFFSRVRASKRDNAKDIGKSILASNVIGATQLATKAAGKSYSKKEISEKENIHMKANLFDPKVGVKNREQWWTQQIRKRILCQRVDQKVAIFPSDVHMHTDRNVTRLVNMIGRTDRKASSTTEMLVNNKMFTEFAKLSSIGPSREWFETVISGKHENIVSGMCQHINLKLVEMLAKAGASRGAAKSQRERGNYLYHKQIWEWLQSPAFDTLVVSTSTFCTSGQRMGVIAIVQVLDDIIEQRFLDGLSRESQNLKMRKGKAKPLYMHDVNQIFGWAIFSLRRAKITALKRYDSDSRQNLVLKDEIEFLSGMRIYSSEAALSDNYLANCYDSYMRTNDRGHLSLVREEYFGVAFQVLDRVSNAFTKESIISGRARDILKEQKEALQEDRDLLSKFLLCSEKNDSHLCDTGKQKIFKVLVTKVCNAVFEDSLKSLRANFTARGTQNSETGLGFRQEMQAQGRKGSSRKRKLG